MPINLSLGLKLGSSGYGQNPIPLNALMLNGKPLLINGKYLVLGGA